MLDTNIYGLMISEYGKNVHDAIHISENLIICGCTVIRKELRATNRNVEGINLRMNLLRVYDDLVKTTYEIDDKTSVLAHQYFVAYQKLGGMRPEGIIMNDFLIVACASCKQLDIVVSHDKRTMLGDNAIRAYELINQSQNIRLPRFIGYEGFKN